MAAKYSLLARLLCKYLRQQTMPAPLPNSRAINRTGGATPVETIGNCIENDQKLHRKRPETA